MSGGTQPYNAPIQNYGDKSTTGRRTVGDIAFGTEPDQATPHLEDSFIGQLKQKKR